MYCHAAEVGHAKREYLEQVSPVDITKISGSRAISKWSVAITRKGAMTHDGIPTTQALTEDVAAASPRRAGGDSQPRTYRRALLVPGRRCTGQPATPWSPATRCRPRTGPQLLPKLFNHDQDGCLRSLAALGLLDTEILLPGHGPVWRGSIREAAEQAAQ